MGSIECFMEHMAIYELDPDVVCWGLHLLDDYTLSHHYSPSIVTQYDPDLSQVEYVTEGFCQHQYVDSDEAVAQAYQEELWQLVSMVASGNDNFGESHNMKEVGNYGPTPSERKNGVHENNVCGSSSGSVEVPTTSTSDDFWDSLEISDESLDGEVGKRLNQMVPIPYAALVSKIPYPNSDNSGLFAKAAPLAASIAPFLK
ncbi:hypothetical protein JHK85_019311 [Glycine max]|nr:hypothetical protein JHK85_019311 [Glycine max]